MLEEYYNLRSDGWLELTKDKLELLKPDDLYTIMENKDYTNKTRTFAVILFLHKKGDDSC